MSTIDINIDHCGKINVVNLSFRFVISKGWFYACKFFHLQFTVFLIFCDLSLTKKKVFQLLPPVRPCMSSSMSHLTRKNVEDSDSDLT